MGIQPVFIGPLWAHLCQQMPARQVNIGQSNSGEGAGGVLGQAAIAHLGKAPQALDHRKHMLDPRTDLRLVAVLAALDLIDFTTRLARALVGKVLGLRRLAVDQFFLAGIRTVADWATLFLG